MRSTLLPVFALVLCACSATADRQPNVHVPSHTSQGAGGRPVTGDGQLTEYVRRILQDSRGHYWFGSNGDGIYRFDGGALEVFSVQEGLAGSQVTGILEDRKGHIWIATDGGVSRYDPAASADSSGRAFVNYTTKQGLSSAGVWAIFETQDGTIWAGTAAGPCRFDGQGFTPFALKVEADMDKAGPWVLSITQDRKGELYFGTEMGVFKTEGGIIQRIPAPNSSGDDMVPCVLVDSKDRVWCSSMTGGLTCYEQGTVKRFTAPGDIGDNEVWTVFEDRQGHIWFCSEGFGVYRADGGTLRNYSTAQGLGVAAVQSIHQDQAGTLWFGGGGGLYRLQGDTMVEVRRNGPWR